MTPWHARHLIKSDVRLRVNDRESQLAIIRSKVEQEASMQLKDVEQALTKIRRNEERHRQHPKHRARLLLKMYRRQGFLRTT